jgi:AraC-like DNA-binding protein
MGTVQWLISLHRRRAEFLPAELFIGDVAWDILLAAYAANTQQRGVTVGEIANRFGISSSTTERWFSLLIDYKLLELEGEGDVNQAYVITRSALESIGKIIGGSIVSIKGE